RHANGGSCASKPRSRSRDNIGGEVSGVAHLLYPHHVIESAARHWRKRTALLYKLGIFRRRTNSRCGVEPRAVKAEQQAELGLANAKRVFQHCVEDRLKFARRGADDTQDLGGRCPLPQRFAQFARALLLGLEQPYVLNSDHCLIGERRRQLDLFSRKWRGRRSVHGHNADASSFSEQGHAEHRTITAESLAFEIGVFPVGQRVGNVYYSSRDGDSSGKRLSAQREGMLLDVFLQFGREAVTRCDAIDAAVTEENGGPFSLAKSCRRLGKSIQHHLKIEGRAADNLEHIGGRGRRLKRMAEFVEERTVVVFYDGLICEHL